MGALVTGNAWLVGREVGDGGGDKVNLGDSIRVGFTDALGDLGGPANILIVQPEEHDHEIWELDGADASDFRKPGARIDKDVIWLEMVIDGGLPVLEKGGAEAAFVKFRPVDAGELMVIGGVFASRGHDGE